MIEGLTTTKIGTLSISFMVTAAILSILLPIALAVFLGRSKRLNWKAMLFGVSFFILFAMILENIMHFLVLGNDLNTSVIYNNTLLYTLYGGLAAGIFEETARLICFKSVLKIGQSENIDTGISYGLGHGGIEALLIGGLAAIGNLFLALSANTGALSSAAASMDKVQLDSLNQTVDLLASTPSHLFLMAGMERVVALALQVALSVFVFKAVQEKKWQYFLYAVFIHAGIDMIAVLYQKGVLENVILFEGIFMVATAVVAVMAFKIVKKAQTSSM